ncbi:FecR family protein [Carboxylicivirga sp. RSCT41]|uniref:FecR family protein n=1 Tax=Carboxylicivirga agarovorans TaxID=3417570 RepID=UPI003D35167A
MQKEAPIKKILSKLDHSITAEDSQELDSWRKTSEENESFYKTFTFLWNDKLTGKSSYHPETEKALSITHLRISRRQFMRRMVNAAAVLTALIAIGSILLMLQSTKHTIKIIADRQKEFTLPDKTTVILAKGSELTYPDIFKSSKREVELVGKAWFHVTHKPEQPFIVETHNAFTKVLGTQFTIAADKTEPTAVFLDEGKVAFQAKQWFSKSHILNPGEMIDYSNGVYQKIKQHNLNASSWATQQLKFKSTPLLEVIREIETYYNVNIELQTPQIGELRFSGMLKESNAQDALEIVALTLQLRLIQNNKTFTLCL